MMRWIAGLAAALLLPACGGGGNSDHRSDPGGTPGAVGTSPPTPQPTPQPTSQPPTIRILNPASGATSAEGSTVTIEAEVSHPSADMERVDFYDGDRRIGGASSPPYTLSYGPLKSGAPQLCAVAVDFDGNLIVASPPVTLFVLKGEGKRDDDGGGHGHDRKH